MKRGITPIPFADALEAIPEAAALLAEGAMRLKEACTFSGLSRTTLYEAMNAGKLAYVKVGGARRIPKWR